MKRAEVEHRLIQAFYNYTVLGCCEITDELVLEAWRYGIIKIVANDDKYDECCAILNNVAGIYKKED